MTTVTVALHQLTPDPRNARTHDDRNIQEIRRSLERFGQYRPFVVQRDGMVIRVGNGMYRAMLELGWTEGQAIVMDLSDREAEALAVMDNRSAELAQWDVTILNDILAELPDDLLEVSGFSEDEIASLLDGMDDLPPPPPPPGNGPGDNASQADTACVIGAYYFQVERSAYDRLIEDIRQEYGFDEESVVAGLKRRLGL